MAGAIPTTKIIHCKINNISCTHIWQTIHKHKKILLLSRERETWPPRMNIKKRRTLFYSVCVFFSPRIFIYYLLLCASVVIRVSFYLLFSNRCFVCFNKKKLNFSAFFLSLSFSLVHLSDKTILSQNNEWSHVGPIDMQTRNDRSVCVHWAVMSA